VCSAPINCIRKSFSTLCYPFHRTALAINQAYHSLLTRIFTILSYVFPISKEPPATGYVGENLYAANVRILFVNGVGYTKESCAEAAEKISKTFNSSRVDYCFVPICYTQVVQSIVYKKQSKGSELLLKTIRECLKELNQNSLDQKAKILNSGERLIIIAHSAGGIAIETIRNDFKREEKKQIDILSFGSTHHFRKRYGFNRTTNIVARGDPVLYMSEVLLQWVHNLRESQTPPRFVGSLVPKIILGRHSFLGEDYQQALREIKEEYEQNLSFQRQEEKELMRGVTLASLGVSPSFRIIK
jgi:hypothetical protein